VALWRTKSNRVVGMLREKDIQSSAQELIGVFDHLIVTSAPGERGLLASELANSFSDEGLVVDEIVPEFWSAYEQAIRLGASTERPVFITGSLYLVGAVLEKLQLENSKPSDQDGQEVE
jgi:dihydrofolate synthase/folylpolyglutamate synthase